MLIRLTDLFCEPYFFWNFDMEQGMFSPSTITLVATPPRLSDYDTESNDYALKDKDQYHKKLKKAQELMLQVQQAYYHQGKRAIIVFQGWDAAGKGGAIRRIREKLDPRGYRVHPIASPTKDEQGRHYLYRFQARLPKPGSIAIFDRSWYERVLVERIEEFASPNEWQRAYQEINEFERMLTDDGVRIIKIFMHISKDEQLKRFEERLNNPVKQWKLTEEDIRNRSKWELYETATDEMFQRTSTISAPWHIIPGNKKWFARVEVLNTVIEALSKEMDLSPPPVDEAVVKAARKQLGIEIND
ncbi:polyphosphate kinase 2 family protein [Marinomonas fungiae]|uniref:Polyphosphate:nucleotide phosphotransferase, PPK2 family n=1 Tax=Marinomonas fungiae TaxID=1137284 RepID=A0A0K6IH84_9GAMM|nr:PPK2 family polyphosphate kinase [Marinomonas fungiae]CUB02662.1 polyphosphate:nucleotide phosphotransferase, PPK2 family [Marinomonas fungiae]